MQRLEVSGAVRPIYGSLGVKRLNRETSDLEGKENPLLQLRRFLVHYYYYYYLFSPLCRVFTIMYLKNPCLYGTQCCTCSVFTVFATCKVISTVKYVLYFYISTFRGLCAVPNMNGFRNSLISCFPGMLLRY